MAVAASGKSYACFGCVNFANNERTLAYHQWACEDGRYESPNPPVFENLCSCSDDGADGPFLNPIDDGVCWFDPEIPESEDFLGVVILNIGGLRDSTFSREVTDGFIEGSILQRPKTIGRSFVFDVLLVATSCEGRNYGEEWLRALLEGGPCGNKRACGTCAGQPLTIRVACPDDDYTDDGLHTWFNSGLVDGLTMVDGGSPTGAGCCNLTRYTFTMHSESPYSFSAIGEPQCEIEASEDGYIRCFDWMRDCFECCDDENSGCDRCLDDPLCTCFTFPLPTTDLSTGPCPDCPPLASNFACCCTDDLPAGYDTAFKIDIYTGKDWSNQDFVQTGMRDFRMAIYENPVDLPCITDDETYELWCSRGTPCSEFSVRYLPYDSTLTIDGRTNTITITCDGVCKPFEQVVTSLQGDLFPLISRCVPLMICPQFSYYNSQFMPSAPGVEPAKVTVTSYLRFRN